MAGSSRISKPKRKSTAIHPASLEKAIKASQDNETDTSSYNTPTERSASNEASPPSSASSTPRILPAQREEVSSCCKPKAIAPPISQTGGCCSSKAKQQPQPQPPVVPAKSCCSGKAQQNNVPNIQLAGHNVGQQIQFQLQPQFRTPQYQSFQQQSSPAPPFGFGAPIYNHAAAAYQQSMVMPMNGGMHGSLPHQPNGHQIPQHNPEHNCHCGEGCTCFGCAAHPNNATMMEYVRLMAQFQYTGAFGDQQAPLYDMPTYPHHPGFGAETSPAMNFAPLPQPYGSPTPAHIPFQASLDATVMAVTPLSLSSPWRQPSISTPSIEHPQFLDSATPTPTESQIKLEMAPPPTVPAVSTPVADSPGGSNEEETPTLSPSSFFWNEMVLPGCNDATGTCQCGDGCECVGCLTHGGHNGIALEAPLVSEHEPFPSFTAEAGLNLNLSDPSSFLDFHPAS